MHEQSTCVEVSSVPFSVYLWKLEVGTSEVGKEEVVERVKKHSIEIVLLATSILSN